MSNDQFCLIRQDADKMEKITKETIEQAWAKKPKRICFANTHASEPKRKSSPQFVGTINVPFGEGFSRLFPYKLLPNHGGSCWLGIKSEEDFEDIDAWVKSQGTRVFLRDCLYASIAMSDNYTPHVGRTEIGQLEYGAKQNYDMGAVKSLAVHCANTIKGISLYSKADLVCAVPPRLGKNFDLPSRVVPIVSGKVGKEDITDYFSFGAEKRSVKSATFYHKWSVWHDARVTFDNDLTNKKIILIDDKYQSGTTIQYIAMKLQEAGAHHIVGLCMVKTRRNTDNL